MEARVIDVSYYLKVRGKYLLHLPEMESTSIAQAGLGLVILCLGFSGPGIIGIQHNI